LSRAARLYSVIVPAFILTAVLDHAGMAIRSRLYAPDVLPEMARPLDTFLGYALSAVFLGASWTWQCFRAQLSVRARIDYEPGITSFFGLAAFLRGRRRMAALAAAALLAGTEDPPPLSDLADGVAAGVGAPHWRAATGSPARARR